MPLLLQGAACARALPARRSRCARHAAAAAPPRAHAAPPPAPAAPAAPAALSRRAALAAAPALLAAAAAALQAPPPALAAPQPLPSAPAPEPEPAPAPAPLLFVRPGPDDTAANTYGTIAAALEAAPEGAVVRISGAYYPERLLVTKAVTLEPAPGDEGKVVVEHETELPYESTLQARGIRRWCARRKATRDADSFMYFAVCGRAG
jgi:hypothetical protein